jgi:anti-sigma factor RsiW
MTTAPDHNPLVDEQLSAWLDDELPRAELELLVARLAASPELKARLARYSLIASSVRGSQAGNVSTELAALRLGGRVRAALEEPADSERQPAPVRTKRVLPYAMAAGLALAAVAFSVAQGPLLTPVGGPVQASAQPFVAGPAPGPVGQASLSSRRLTNYLVYHGKYSGPLSARVTESHIVSNRPHALALQAVDRPPTQ